MRRHELTDEKWEIIKPLLPIRRTKVGRPSSDYRMMLNAIFWLLRTGVPWRDLPVRFGPWRTVYGYFQKWRDDGTFQRILEALQIRLDRKGQIDWNLFCIDASSIRATRAAAGASKESTIRYPYEPADHGLGRSRGGFGSKIHLVTDGSGLPLAVETTAGQCHESKYFESVLDRIAIAQPIGRPRKRPSSLAGDKGYSCRRIRIGLRSHRIKAVIAQRSDQRQQHKGRPLKFDKELYRARNVIERCVGWLKEYRRICTRFEKLAISFVAMLQLAMIDRYLRIEFSNRA
jgi:transposase